MAEILSFISAKGGTGKTTAACLTAMNLSKLGNKVILMDLNAGIGGVERIFDVSGRVVYHLADVLEGNCKIIQSFIHPETVPELYILAAPLSRDGSSVSPAKLLKLLELFSNQFDYIVLDIPTGDNVYYRVLRETSTKLVFVTGLDKLSLSAGENFIKKMPVTAKAKSFVLLNRVRKDLLRSDLLTSPEEALNTLKTPLLGIVAEEEEIYMLAEETGKIGGIRSFAGKEFMNVAMRITGKDLPFELK